MHFVQIGQFSMLQYIFLNVLILTLADIRPLWCGTHLCFAFYAESDALVEIPRLKFILRILRPWGESWRHKLLSFQIATLFFNILIIS